MNKVEELHPVLREKKDEPGRPRGFFDRRNPPPPQRSPTHAAPPTRRSHSRSSSSPHPSFQHASRRCSRPSSTSSSSRQQPQKSLLTDSPALTVSFDAPPSRSPLMSPHAASAPTGTNVITSATPSNSSRPARLASGKHGVSFSPSVRFDSCKQRVNIAVPHDSGYGGDDEGDSYDLYNDTDTTRSTTLSFCSSSASAKSPGHTNNNTVGHRLIRANAFHRKTKKEVSTAITAAAAAATEVERNHKDDDKHISSVDDENQRSIVADNVPPSPERRISRSLSPVNSLLSSDGSAYDVNYRTPSPLRTAQLTEALQPGQLSPKASSGLSLSVPANTESRLCSPEIDLLSLSESLPHELRRTSATCLRAIGRPSGGTSLVSRILSSKRQDSSPGLRQRGSGSPTEATLSTNTIAEQTKRNPVANKKAKGNTTTLVDGTRRCISSGSFGDVRRTATSENTAVTAAAMDEEGTLLQDRRYVVDVSAVNLIAVAVNAKRNEQAITAAATTATTKSQPKRVSSAMERKSAKADPAKELSSSSLTSLTAVDRLLEDLYDTLPAVSASGQHDDDLPADAMMLELLKDEDSAVVSARGSCSLVAARVAPSNQNSQPSSAANNRSSQSLKSEYSYSLPVPSLPKQDHVIPVLLPNAVETRVKLEKSPHKDGFIQDLSARVFGGFVFGGVNSSRPSSGLRDMEHNLSSVSDTVVHSASGSRSSNGQRTQPSEHLPLLTPPQPQRMPFAATPLSTLKMRPANAVAAASTRGSHLTLSPVSTPPTAFSMSKSGSSPRTSGGPTSIETLATDTTLTPITNFSAAGYTPSSHLTLTSSPPAPSSDHRSSCRMSELNVLLPTDGLYTPHSTTTPTGGVTRAILPLLANEEGDRRNGGSAMHKPLSEVKEATQLHVLRGPAKSHEALVIQAPVHPNVNLPRGTVTSATLHGHGGGNGDGISSEGNNRRQHRHHRSLSRSVSQHQR